MNAVVKLRPVEERQDELGAAERAALVAEAFEAWNHWRSVDHTKVVVMELPERQMWANESTYAAELCRSAAEMTMDPQQATIMHDAQQQLRLNTLFLVPEQATVENIDEALELSIELAEERNEEWSLHRFDKDVKLFDLQYLIAHWEACQANETDDAIKRASLRADSQLILSATIIESVETIEKALKALLVIDVDRNANLAGKKRHIEGHIAEFLLLTACRLNLHFEGQIDRLFARSAIGMEDSSNMAGSELSTDLIVHNPQEGAARFIQAKTGLDGLEQEYAKHITKVFVDWEKFTDDPELVLFLLKDFVDVEDYALQSGLIQELNDRLGLDEQPKKLGGKLETSLQELVTA